MKQADIHQKAGKAPLRLHLAAVDVNNIRQRLKGVKRNADRQCDLRNDRRPSGQALRRSGEKPGIFEHGERAERQNTGENQRKAARALVPSRPDGAGAKEIHPCHPDQQKQVDRLSPGVKYKRKGEQHRVLHAQIP